MARRSRFLWSAHPLRALAETCALGILILFPLSRVVGHLPPPVFSNGTLVLCGACGIWMVLRTRLPRLQPAVQGLWELAVAGALSLLMGLGLRQSTELLGWSEVWRQSSPGEPVTVMLLFLTGPGYLVGRAGVRGWRLWGRLRRRRMLLGLTHAHLTLVVFVVAVFSLLAAHGVATSGSEEFDEPESGGLIAVVADRVFRTALPLVVSRPC